MCWQLRQHLLRHVEGHPALEVVRHARRYVPAPKSSKLLLLVRDDGLDEHEDEHDQDGDRQLAEGLEAVPRLEAEVLREDSARRIQLFPPRPHLQRGQLRVREARRRRLLGRARGRALPLPVERSEREASGAISWNLPFPSGASSSLRAGSSSWAAPNPLALVTVRKTSSSVHCEMPHSRTSSLECSR